MMSDHEDNNAAREVQVVIVGAGISGLTAAYNLKKKLPDLSLVVLEGKERVGGRTNTTALVSKNGSDSWDLGGQWVGRPQVHVMRLLSELELETHPQYLKGRKMVKVGDRKVQSYSSAIPSLSVLELLDLNNYLNTIEKYQVQLDKDDPCTHPRAEEWDALSVGAHINLTMYTQGAKACIVGAMRCMIGLEVSQMSFLYYLYYVRMAGDITKLIEATDNTAQEYKIIGGSQQISTLLAQSVGENNVRLGDGVASIVETAEYIEVSTTSGKKWRTQHVIMATPPKAIENIVFSPPLPIDKLDLYKRMPMASMIKVVITYEEAFWRTAGFSGEIVTDGAPLCIVYDGASHTGSPGLVGFVGGQPAVDLAQLTGRERQKTVLDHLAVFFGDQVYEFLDYAEKDWNKEAFSWGGPVSFVSPGGMHNWGALKRPEGTIHFAGTETATDWSGYMSGAVQAGERAAMEVVHSISPQSLSCEEIAIAKATSLAKVQPEAKKQRGCSKKWLLPVIIPGVAALAWFSWQKFKH